MDTCGGASIFPRGFDRSATDDSTVAPVRLSSATDDPVHGDAGKKSCCGIGEASQQGNWFVFGPKLSSDVARLEWIISHDMCEEPKRGKVGETPRSVHVRRRNTRTEHRCAQIPEWQGDAIPMQLEESEETRTIPAKIITDLTWCRFFRIDVGL